MGTMIKFENGTLVLNSIFTKEDVAEINEYVEHVRNQERESVLALLDEMLEDKSGINLRGAIELLRDEKHPPKRFRDISNGE